ncbi:hypothetical protein OUZ56_032627 [Daphnia magna]|uniref:Uncharacterized protein n=1 Tax=Daphnia magna TaxID=35525 RepID=A0ABR0B9G0_9CRUS|nr:hypothetical protein OUZ56_032627 [Daphnia magna]
MQRVRPHSCRIGGPEAARKSSQGNPVGGGKCRLSGGNITVRMANLREEELGNVAVRLARRCRRKVVEKVRQRRDCADARKVDPRTRPNLDSEDAGRGETHRDNLFCGGGQRCGMGLEPHVVEADDELSARSVVVGADTEIRATAARPEDSWNIVKRGKFIASSGDDVAEDEVPRRPHVVTIPVDGRLRVERRARGDGVGARRRELPARATRTAAGGWRPRDLRSGSRRALEPNLPREIGKGEGGRGERGGKRIRAVRRCNNDVFRTRGKGRRDCRDLRRRVEGEGRRSDAVKRDVRLARKIGAGQHDARPTRDGAARREEAHEVGRRPRRRGVRIDCRKNLSRYRPLRGAGDHHEDARPRDLHGRVPAARAGVLGGPAIGHRADRGVGSHSRPDGKSTFVGCTDRVPGVRRDGVDVDLVDARREVVDLEYLRRRPADDDRGRRADVTHGARSEEARHLRDGVLPPARGKLSRLAHAEVLDAGDRRDRKRARFVDEVGRRGARAHAAVDGQAHHELAPDRRREGRRGKRRRDVRRADKRPSDRRRPPRREAIELPALGGPAGDVEPAELDDVAERADDATGHGGTRIAGNAGLCGGHWKV